MTTVVEDSVLIRTCSQSKRAVSRRLAAHANRLIARTEALRLKLPRPIKGGSGRTVIAGRINAVHEDSIEIGTIRIHTPEGMLTKELMVGASVTVMMTRQNGLFLAESITVLSDANQERPRGRTS